MSCRTFLISDLHFGHKHICAHVPQHRPFTNLDDMHGEMIKRWNAVVREADRVFVLGDFCFGEKSLFLAGYLKGTKWLIAGNHDTLSTDKYLKYFHKVMGAMEFDGNILTHIPVHPSQFSRYLFNLHGHLHTAQLPDDRYINMSCELHDLTPQLYDTIIEQRIKRLADEPD